MLETVTATRFAVPLREGGSLPGLVDGDDLGMYVVKFRGSVGTHLGLDYLPGSFGYDGSRPATREEAEPIVWLDAFTAHIDRTWANPNLLVRGGRPWTIDHGAALYFHHSWRRKTPDAERFARQPFDASGHVLGDLVGDLRPVHERLAALLTDQVLRKIISLVPEEWLATNDDLPTVESVRVAYLEHVVAARPTGCLAARRCAMSLLPYQYVVLRCVPRAEREEFVNVGIVLRCQAADHLEAAFAVDRDRVRALAPDLDLDELDAALRTVCDVAVVPETGAAAPVSGTTDNASAGSAHHAPPSCGPVRSTVVSRMTPRPRSSASSSDSCADRLTRHGHLLGSGAWTSRDRPHPPPTTCCRRCPPSR